MIVSASYVIAALAIYVAGLYLPDEALRYCNCLGRVLGMVRRRWPLLAATAILLGGWPPFL